MLYHTGFDLTSRPWAEWVFHLGLAFLFRVLFCLWFYVISTTTKYSATYARWKRWVRDHDLPAFPASPYHFALFLHDLMVDAKMAAPIESAIHGIAWVHHLAGERSPSEHPLVKDVLAGAQRLLTHHTSKKEPIAVSQLEQLVNSKALSIASLYDIRSVLICLLAFTAFLRFDELAKLVRSCSCQLNLVKPINTGTVHGL